MDAKVMLLGQSVQISDPIVNLITSSQKCEFCIGDGWRLNASRKAYACECQTASRIAKRIWREYWTARIDDFRSATKSAMTKWLNDGASRGLFIFGLPGVGKTHLAVAICRALLESHRDVQLRKAADFYRELRESFSSERGERSVMTEYVRSPWLLLDDIGAGALTDFERRYLAELLDARMGSKTIVTSNLTIDDFGKRLDERIASRLSAFTSLHCQGADRRAARNV